MNMKKETGKRYVLAGCLLAAFAAWTIAVGTIDVQTIGPQGTAVGFATVNRFVHNLTGVHLLLYVITDWLGLVPFCIAAGFGIFGLLQWIHRKHFWKVDASILLLGVFYLVVMSVYVFFELVVVNYRPLLIDGRLEASYPSSTTMLALCIMPTALMQLNGRVRNAAGKRCVNFVIHVFTLFMVIGRLLSGVHWLSDIVGGILLSGGLVMLYAAVSGWKVK